MIPHNSLLQREVQHARRAELGAGLDPRGQGAFLEDTTLRWGHCLQEASGESSAGRVGVLETQAMGPPLRWCCYQPACGPRRHTLLMGSLFLEGQTDSKQNKICVCWMAIEAKN